jgi:hypothetical protein
MDTSQITRERVGEYRKVKHKGENDKTNKNKQVTRNRDGILMRQSEDSSD